MSPLSDEQAAEEYRLMKLPDEAGDLADPNYEPFQPD
jgi:hypothetical protein